MHSIQSVSEHTGLSADVIRVWERRYQAVNPERTSSNQRLYSDADIERLGLLKKVTESGRRISSVANLSVDDLRKMVAATSALSPSIGLSAESYSSNQTQILRQQALQAILELENKHLEQAMEKSLIGLGGVAFLSDFVAPVLEQVGTMWRSGSIRTCHEHFASAHFRSYLGKYLLGANTDANGPRFIAATLPGQLHEMGALMSAIVAAHGGWNVIYLGPGVPVEELIFTADCKEAKAVGISIGYPWDDPRIGPMLTELKNNLNAQCSLLVGGKGAARFGKLLAELEAEEITGLTMLANSLDSKR